MEIFTTSNGDTYYRVITSLGIIWVFPTDANHIYCDANHHCLSKNIPARPLDDRCEPLTVNRVEYGTSAHLYKWSDGKFHLGQEKELPYQRINSNLHMSRLNAKTYNESHASEAAKKKVIAVLETEINEWVSKHQDILRHAELNKRKEQIESMREQVEHARNELQAQKDNLAKLEKELAEMERD